MTVYLAALGVQLSVFLIIWLILGGICLILQLVAWWRVFTKAGQPGWKSLIPIYSTYIQFKIAWDTQYFWLSVSLSVAAAIASLLGAAILLVSATVISGMVCTVLALLVLAASVATFIINILLLYHLSLVFGHGTGFTLGLLFLQPIFILILGLGSSQYWGGGYAPYS